MKKQSDENRITITRKYVIRPVESQFKEWKRKVVRYLEDKKQQFENILNDKTAQLEKATSKDKKKSLAEQIEKTKKYIDIVSEELDDAKNDIFTQKVVNNYTYNLVKVSMESEARRKNYILSWCFSEMIESGVQYMDTKERNKFITELLKPAYRIKGSMKGSIFDYIEIDNILKGYGNGFSQMLTSKIKDAVRDGLLDGKISLPTYKLNSPFTVSKDYISVSHEYDSFEELCENIDKPGCKIYFNFGGNQNPTIAKFYIDTGSNRNKDELNSTLLKIVSGEYKVCGSSIQLAKDDKKIVLNLSMSIPKKTIELDENIVVGVDLGLAIPAFCALNTNDYIRKSIGSINDFLRIRTQLQAQIRRLQKSLKSTSGGHGRKKKLQALEKLKARERNFVNTYNHYISKQVVDFAIKNKAKYINIEDLSGYDSNQFVLRNWSYYELQQFIIYKATKYGIEVRKIQPYYTSQICSKCGNLEEGQRIGQPQFICKKCGNKMNADFNAARNIAMSTKFVNEKKILKAA